LIIILRFLSARRRERRDPSERKKHPGEGPINAGKKGKRVEHIKGISRGAILFSPGREKRGAKQRL